MRVDILTIEVGSTITKLNAFLEERGKIKYLGKGLSLTTIEEDVMIGIESAYKDLCRKLGVSEIYPEKCLAGSSAGGGLKISVHGLVEEMTVRAGKEAALGAGGIIVKITSGKISQRDLKDLEEIKPNLILLVGGVEGGEKDIILENAQMLSALSLDIPILYAGNSFIQGEIKEILRNKKVYFAPNVYPRVDQLRVEPVREKIQKVFEEHIIFAKGLDKLSKIVSEILPVPRAVLEACMYFYEKFGDVLLFDVGGATTDVHSVTYGSPSIQEISVSPEPLAKRTVEGDLGVYRNLKIVWEYLGRKDSIPSYNPLSPHEEILAILPYITKEICRIAWRRHMGTLNYIYTPWGKKTIAEGRDLSGIKYIIGTGGALVYSPFSKEILSQLNKEWTEKDLAPPKNTKILIDKKYLFSSIGLMVKEGINNIDELIKETLEDEVLSNP